MSKLILLVVFQLSMMICLAQSDPDTKKELDALRQEMQAMQHEHDKLLKQIDDILWQQKLEDIAYVDKLFITGPPAAKEDNPNAQGVGNPLKFWVYAFIPRNIDPSKKYPLLVLPHGGVHSDFTTYYLHIVREMMAQGYVVVAPEYRGSSGYGVDFYKQIDYGGLEVQDVKASRDFMLDNYSFIDKNRVGIIGWSHGGLICLMNIFEYPSDYQVAFAGVPVSDLVARMGYQTQDYRDLFEADYHIGQSANENVKEYQRRSPAWNAHKFQNTPLLIHSNTNDDDVYVLEVEHLIKSLKAEGKKFEYEIYQNLEGGHSFDRIDTRTAQEIRVKIYKFLAGELNPPSPINSLEALRKAAYRF